MDAYALIAQAKVAAEEISGAQFNPSLGYTNLSLEQASGKVVDEDVARAKSTPQSPADPRWQRRLPPPPCEYAFPLSHARAGSVCGMDHHANRMYDHPYVHPIQAQRAQEAQAMIDPYATAAAMNGYAPTTPSAQGRRVAIYDSRTGYIVKVEQAPDWDDLSKSKMDRSTLTALLPILRALGIKIKNNSEDEFSEDGENNKGAGTSGVLGKGYEDRNLLGVDGESRHPRVRAPEAELRGDSSASLRLGVGERADPEWAVGSSPLRQSAVRESEPSLSGNSTRQYEGRSREGENGEGGSGLVSSAPRTQGDRMAEKGEGGVNESGEDPIPVAPSVAARANRPREDIRREWEELLPGTTPPSASAVDSAGDERPDSGGQEVGAAHRAGDGEDST